MSKEVKFLLKEAKKNLDEENFQEAISLCQQILTSDENSYHALVILGAALFGTGKLQEASQKLEQAITIDEKSPLAWQGLGKVYESEKMLTRLKRSKIGDVYRKLCGFFSVNETDWMKLTKSKSLLARTLVFDFTEIELSKEDKSAYFERLKEATSSLKDAWNLMSKHVIVPTELSPIFSLFIEQVRQICSVENNNPAYNDCALLLKDVYFKIFQLDALNEDSVEDGTNPWLALLPTFAPQDVAVFVNDCVSLVVKLGMSGEVLDGTVWRLIQINGTPKALLMYCQLMLEKSLTQPQIAKVRQLVGDEQSVLKAEYQRQTGPRLSSITKFESDNLHLVFGCLAMFEGNKSRALEELSAISDPQHPIMFAYLARAYLDCGRPDEAVAVAIQGLRYCSLEATKKSTYPTLFSCFYDKRVVSTELEALRVLGLLECGTEPSFASLVQEIDDLISQDNIVSLGCETLAYVACRLHSSSLTNKKPELKVQSILRKLELDMRYAISAGNPGEALEILDNSGAPGVENDIFLLTVESLACSCFNETESDKFSRGTAAATRALSIAPKYALAHWTMGRCLFKIKQTGEAEQHFAEACSTQPLNSSIAYDYCKIMFTSQRHDECAAIVSRLVDVSSPAQWPYIRLALYHLEQKNANVAINLLLAALRCPKIISQAVESTSLDSKPQNRLIILWRCLGMAYLQKGSLASAVRALNHCAALTESQKFDTASASSLSEAYLRLGRTDAVVKCLEEECEPTSNGAINIRKFIQIATAELQNARSYTSQCPECVATKCLRVMQVLFERTSRDQWTIALLWKIAGDAAMLLADAFDNLSPNERPQLGAKTVQILQLQSAPSEANDWLMLAGRFYSTGIRVNPNLPQLWSDLSLARARLSSAKCSIEAQLVSAQLFDSQSSWCNLGMACALFGKNAAAQHYFLSILPNAGQSPFLLISMGVLYIVNKKFKLAEDALNYARQMVEAGCVETVTRPEIVPALYMAETALKAATNGKFKLKNLVDLVHLASAVPISASFRCKLAIFSILFRQSVLYFSKTTTVQIRNSKLNCKVFFEQLLHVVDTCALLFNLENDQDKEVLQKLAGLCGHIVELSPGSSIQWQRSARFFEKSCSLFDWHKFRAKCLGGIDNLGEIPSQVGDRAYFLGCLVGFRQKSPSFPEIMAKVNEMYGEDLDLSIATGLAYALTGSYPAAKERLVKILISVKQSDQTGNEHFLTRLLGILGKMAVLTGDAQLQAVVASLSGPSLPLPNMFDLVHSENCTRSLVKFVHQLPFREEAWHFALRHALVSGGNISKTFCQTAMAHVPCQDRLVWAALVKGPEDRKSAMRAVHLKPYDPALWVLVNPKLGTQKIQSFSVAI